MSNHVHPPTKVLAVIGVVIAFWLLVTLVILGAFGIHEGWPAFLTLPLFLLGGGTDKKQLINVFAGAIVGLLLGAALAPVIGLLVKSTGIGVQPGILIVVGIFVFCIVALGGLVPYLFNNYTFVYFTVALIFTKQATLPWLGTLIGGGAFFALACLLSISFITPRLMKTEHTNADI